MPTYKLTYFAVKGLGEPIRFLFNYGGIDFIDDRVEIDNWPNLKSSTPWGQLPILEVDGKKITQSVAICRYLAKKIGLAGKDDWEALLIDAAVDTIHDLRAKIAAWSYEKDEAVKNAKYDVTFKELVPFYLERLDAQVKANGGYFVGGSLSWADITFVGMLDYLNYMCKFDLVENWANLKQLKAKVSAEPKIKAWLDKRPATEF